MAPPQPTWSAATTGEDRKSTRLNSSHGSISYAVFCLKKKKHRAAYADAMTKKMDHRYFNIPFVFRAPKDDHVFFFNDTATNEIYTLSLHDALPIFKPPYTERGSRSRGRHRARSREHSGP